MCQGPYEEGAVKAEQDDVTGELPRWVELAEVDNIRDLGGLPVRGGGTTRRGVVFRASTLQEATAQDVEVLLGRYGLRTVLDLRAPDEAACEGHGLLADTAVRRMNLPVSRVQALVTDVVPAMTEDDGDTAGFYLGLLDGSGDSLVAAARVVADTWEWLRSLSGSAPLRPDRPAVGLDPAKEAEALGL
jgi:hypothetical protein